GGADRGRLATAALKPAQPLRARPGRHGPAHCCPQRPLASRCMPRRLPRRQLKASEISKSGYRSAWNDRFCTTPGQCTSADGDSDIRPEPLRGSTWSTTGCRVGDHAELTSTGVLVLSAHLAGACKSPCP